MLKDRARISNHLWSKLWASALQVLVDVCAIKGQHPEFPEGTGSVHAILRADGDVGWARLSLMTRTVR